MGLPCLLISDSHPGSYGDELAAPEVSRETVGTSSRRRGRLVPPLEAWASATPADMGASSQQRVVTARECGRHSLST